MISCLAATFAIIWFIALKVLKMRHRLSELILGGFFLWGALMLWIATGMWSNKFDQVLPGDDDIVDYKSTCYGGCGLMAFNGVVYFFLGFVMILFARLSPKEDSIKEKTASCCADVEAPSLGPDNGFRSEDPAVSAPPASEAQVAESIPAAQK